MAKAGAVVNIVSAHHHPGELLYQVVFLIGYLRRGDDSELIPPVIHKLLGNKPQRLIPGRWHKLTVLLDQGGDEALGVMHKAQAEAPLDAGLTVIHRTVVLRRGDANDFIRPKLKPKLTTDATIRACGKHLALTWPCPTAGTIHERPRGANIHA